VSIDNTDVNVVHDTGTVIFTFSEAPTTFTLADTWAAGGTLSGLTEVDATHYIATFTATPNIKLDGHDDNFAYVGVSSGTW
jgi:hypothetical protein